VVAGWGLVGTYTFYAVTTAGAAGLVTVATVIIYVVYVAVSSQAPAVAGNA
jgi:hypothetical protein